MITKDELKITQKELDATKIERLPNRPNTGASIGGGALSATEMKRRYDAAPALIREKFNALVDALAGIDETGALSDGVASLIMTGLAKGHSLTDLFRGLADGSAMQLVRAGIDAYTVKGYMLYLKGLITDKFGRTEAEAWRIEIDKEIDVVEQESIDRDDAMDREIKLLKVAIEFIKDGTTTEEIDSIKELVSYVNEHGKTTAAMLGRISQNEKNIQSHHETFAGALKGSLQGTAVAMNDVSAVSHELDVRLYPKNLIPFPYTTQSNTVNGVTFTVQSDGGISMEGEATDYAEMRLFEGRMLLPAGSYVVSGMSEAPSGVFLNVRQLIDGVDTHFTNNADTPKTKKTDFVVNRISITVHKGTVIPEGTVVYPMFQMGSVATAYAPYVAPDRTKVMICGKNLLNVNSAGQVGPYYGVDVTQLLSGRSAHLSIRLRSGKTCPTGINFGFAYRAVGNTNFSAAWMVNKNVEGIVMQNYDCSEELAKNHECYAIVVYPASKENWDAIIDAFDIQLEIGSAATPYEPYEVTEYTPRADGVVAGVASIHPNMLVTTEDGTATLAVKYNRDINIALERMEQAIISLGGNV